MKGEQPSQTKKQQAGEEELQQLRVEQRREVVKEEKEQQQGTEALQLSTKMNLQRGNPEDLEQRQRREENKQQQRVKQQLEQVEYEQPAQQRECEVSPLRRLRRQDQLLRRCAEAAAVAGLPVPVRLCHGGTAAFSSVVLLGCSLLLLLLQCSLLDSRGSGKGALQPFFLLQPAACFNVQAQEAASMTTLSGLSATANQALRRLLNGKDLADVAGWAHRVAEKYPDTARLSYMQQPACPSTHVDVRDVKLDTSACQQQGNCLLEATTYFFFQLVDPVQNTVPQPDPEVISTNNFVFPHGIKTTDADSVKYTINLIGDLHSPLHWGSAEDDFGRRLVVQYTDDSTTYLTSFANYFEEALVQKTIRQRQYFWYSGWTHVNSIKGTYETEKTLFAVNKEKMFMRWAIENRAVLCNELYPQLRKTGKDARAAAAALGPAAVDRHALAALAAYPEDVTVPLYEISALPEYALFEVLRKRILLAGARTAVVMNHILQVRQEKDLGKLRQGTGVADVVDAVEPPLVVESRPLLYFKNFLINVAIFIVIFLFFVYISRFYSSPPAHSPAAHRGTAAGVLSPTSKPAAAATLCTPGRTGVEMENIKNN